MSVDRYEPEPDDSVPYDASDERAVRAARSRARREDEERLEMVKAVMSMPQGRKWVWGILAHCAVLQTPFATNALVMAFTAGKQDVGHFIIRDIMEVAPEMYLKMAAEAKPAVRQKEKENGGRGEH